MGGWCGSEVPVPATRTQRIRGYRRRKVLPWFFVAKLSPGPQRARPFPGDLSSRGGPGWPQARELLDPTGKFAHHGLDPKLSELPGSKRPPGCRWRNREAAAH